jgi:hypothetical protein
MALTEIMDKPIGVNEIPKMVTFLNEFLQCDLRKCGAIENLPVPMKSPRIVRVNSLSSSSENI